MSFVCKALIDDQMKSRLDIEQKKDPRPHSLASVSHENASTKKQFIYKPIKHNLERQESNINLKFGHIEFFICSYSNTLKSFPTVEGRRCDSLKSSLFDLFNSSCLNKKNFRLKNDF